MEKKEKLMIEIAKMYYYYGYSQKKISETVNLSRAYICQLLEQARQEGIVEVKIKDSATNLESLENWLTENFQLKKVKVFQDKNLSTKDYMISSMSKEVSELLRGLVKDDSILAFSWGETLYNISKEMKVESDIKNVKVIPLSGGIGNIKKNNYTHEISTNFAKIYNGTPYVIPLPVIVDSEKIKNSIYSDAAVSTLLEMVRQADAAVFTVGNPGADNALFQSGFIDKHDLKQLQSRGLVGDLCAHFLNKNGMVCDEEYDKRTISISLNEMKKIPEKICVVYDVSKARILLNVLKGGYVDYLFVDEATASLLRYANPE